MDKQKKYIENAEDIFDTASQVPIGFLEIRPEKIICPECGGLTTEGLVFCELCGGELEPMEPEEYEKLKEKFGNIF